MTRETQPESREEKRMVEDITFGIEIECYLPRGTFRIGSYHSGATIFGAPTEGVVAGCWNTQHDGSVCCPPAGYEGVEIVSPVLHGAAGLRNVRAMVAKLNELEACVNHACGFHIHVGFPNDPAKLERLTTLVANFEKAVYASTGTHRREQNHYCQSIRQTHRSVNFRSRRSVEANGSALYSHYAGLNVSNLLYGRQPTVEFRAFAGTVNAEKITGYIRMVVGLVERALTVSRKTTWDAKMPVTTSPIHRNGDGQTALTRLFYQLGWTKGRTSHVYGNLIGSDLPDIKASKKLLMKLARKYDRS